MARNRVIYQSEALFVTAQYTGGKTIDIVNGTHVDAATLGEYIDGSAMQTGHFHQIHRVQSANYNFAINRTDVNQFGNLARIDTAVIDAPTVGLDFSYLVTNGLNEDKLGITAATQGMAALKCSAISGILSNISGRNYHILTVTEGEDANQEGLITATTNKAQAATSTVISIGNGYVTNYSVNASVGAIPTASVSVEGLNISAQTAGTGLSTPSINPNDGTQGTAKFSLPHANKGSVGEILRPGDIDVNLTSNAGRHATGLLANFADGAKTAAHIQSFSIDLPLGRSLLQRLGNSFGFAREVDFPVQVSCSISAIAADLKAGNLFNELYDNTKSDIEICMRAPNAGGAGAGDPQMRYMLKNVTLESESFSSSIGDNKSVDLTFSATVGGPDDITNGLFISGTQVPDKQKEAS